MAWAYGINVTVHVLAAVVWLGGLFFVGLVGAPVLRRVEPPALRQQLFHTLGTRFRAVAWVSIAVLLLTGVANLHFREWLRWDVLGSSAFWGTPVGVALGIKLVAVAIVVTLSAVHDFVVGPAAGHVAAGTPEAIALRRRAAWFGRINAMVGLILLIAAVRLPRG